MNKLNIISFLLFLSRFNTIFSSSSSSESSQWVSSFTKIERVQNVFSSICCSFFFIFHLVAGGKPNLFNYLHTFLWSFHLIRKSSSFYIFSPHFELLIRRLLFSKNAQHRYVLSSLCVQIIMKLKLFTETENKLTTPHLKHLKLHESRFESIQFNL